MKKILDLLKEINVLCRDDGEKFDTENSARISVIKEKLSGSDYQCTKSDLFLLFHKKDLSQYTDGVVLLSTHIDCKRAFGMMSGITRCFSEQVSDELIKGTYDNSITNTAALYLMMNERLSDNVIVAFTGDEEEDSGGAIQVMKLLDRYSFEYKCIVLDVTDAGWQECVDFTIENNFWNKKMGKKVISKVENLFDNWLFVPEEMDNIPDYVSKSRIYHETSEPDESWEYDEKGIECFSLCIPVNGEMHSDEGVLARVSNLEKYIGVLCQLANCDYE